MNNIFIFSGHNNYNNNKVHVCVCVQKVIVIKEIMAAEHRLISKALCT